MAVSFYLAKDARASDPRDAAVLRRACENVCPASFVPGITRRRSKQAATAPAAWDAAGVPDLDQLSAARSMFAARPTTIVATLRLRRAYPGMQHITCRPADDPKDKMVEQYRMVGELVMPHFRSRPAVLAAAK